MPSEDLNNHVVLPRALHGPDGGAKFVGDSETGLLEETPRSVYVFLGTWVINFESESQSTLKRDDW